MSMARALHGGRRATGALTLLLLLSGCGGSEPAAPSKPAVTVAAVTQGPVPIVMPFSGTLKAVRTVQVIPHVSGYIGKRYFTEGASVEEGDPLYRIDPRPFEATLDAFEAELAKDQANLEYWTSEARRFSETVASGAVSKQEYDSAQAQLREAQANVQRSQAQIEGAKLDLGYTDIESPFKARAQQTRFYEGDLVTEYEDVLTTLVQMDPVHVIFNLSRRELYRIQKLEREGTVPAIQENARVELVLPDGSAYPKQGKLDFVSAQIDTTTDTVTLRAIIENQIEGGTEALVPGQYVPVRLVLGERSDALMIPQAALLETQAGQHVLVVAEGGQVESRPVEVGQSYRGSFVIEKGLQPGEQVIVEGLHKAKPGMSVDAQPAGSPKASSPPPDPSEG